MRSKVWVFLGISLLLSACTHAPLVAKDTSAEVRVPASAKSYSERQYVSDRNELLQIQRKMTSRLRNSFEDQLSTTCERGIVEKGNAFLKASYPSEHGTFKPLNVHDRSSLGRGGSIVTLFDVYKDVGEGSYSYPRAATFLVTGLDYGDRCVVTEITLLQDFSDRTEN